MRAQGLDFDGLQMRVDPAASRIKMLAGEIPSSVVFWDVLCVDDVDLRGEPFRDRRSRLEALLANAKPPLHVTPATTDRATAADWFQRFEGAGLDGVMAKQAAGSYEPSKRSMLKLKHERDCDCVMAGFRWHKNGEGTAVGSLSWGSTTTRASCSTWAVVASFTAAKRQELVKFLAPYRDNSLEEHPWRDWASHDEGSPEQRMPGAKNRWTGVKDLSWQPLRPELVVEVAYEHMQGDRFRHTAQFRRWRDDKKPNDCTYAQLEVVAPHELARIFAVER